MAEYTLTYSEGVKGWPSFYSFIPEWIQGSNNYLYTFNGGNIWRHNVNNSRANFYGTQHTSSVTTVLNQSSLETKVFKSITLVGTPGVGWGTSIVSNLETTAHTTNFNFTVNGDQEWVSSKEGHMFSYIYNSAVTNTNISQTVIPVLVGDDANASRSMTGIGLFPISDVESLGGSNYRINFPLGFQISPLAAVGDLTICSVPSGLNLGISWWTGVITAIGVNNDYSATPPVPPDSPFVGQPMIELDISPAVFAPDTFIGQPNNFLTIFKNTQVESYGILGDYAEITLSLTTASAVELFSVGSEVMKSNP
tara:strand:- start:693 stop:1619 length:927 start_codon:yes stop_codon:yes gene_type:complete